jgi:hypothetical protein
MHSAEQPHGDLLVLPSDIWENLSPDRQESAIRLLAKLAYELVTARRSAPPRENGDELPPGD